MKSREKDTHLELLSTFTKVSCINFLPFMVSFNSLCNFNRIHVEITTMYHAAFFQDYWHIFYKGQCHWVLIHTIYTMRYSSVHFTFKTFILVFCRERFFSLLNFHLCLFNAYFLILKLKFKNFVIFALA